MDRMREVLVFTKDVDGGIASLLEQLSRLESQDLQFTLVLYKKSDSTIFSGKIRYISSYYPEGHSFSITKIYRFVSNVIQTHLFLKKHSSSKKLFACDMYAAIILLFLKITLDPKIHVDCLVNSNFQKIISQKSSILYRFLLRWVVVVLYKHADHIVYVSQELAQASNRFLGISSQRSITIPNGISRTVVQTKLNTTVDDTDLIKMRTDTSFKVISVGRFSPQKDFHTLIYAFAEVYKKYKNCSLYIIGDGLLRSELESLCANLNLGSVIHFLGWKKNVYPFYKEADICVLSTHFEGFGRVILEAMVCKLPVISTDVDYGPAEILNGGDFGLLVEEGNVQMMSVYILQLIHSESERNNLAERAYQRVDDFPEKAMLERYRKIFMS